MLQRVFDFGHAFAHTGKNRFRRAAAGGQHPRQLTARNNIKAAAQAGKMAQNAQIAVGLYRIANQWVQRRKGVLVLAEGIGKRLGAVNIQRRAVGGGQIGQWHLFAV